MLIITKACGTAKLIDPMSWPSRGEMSSTSSARSVFVHSISQINTHTYTHTDLLVEALFMYFDFLFSYLALSISSLMMNNMQLAIR